MNVFEETKILTVGYYMESSTYDSDPFLGRGVTRIQCKSEHYT